ncbi:MAG: ASKHA domain-containing protein [Chloroflexota bacterium]|nr:ASKHA domain-containing protein [Chloroflexota bacterium]
MTLPPIPGCQVDFAPQGLRVRCPVGTSILDVARASELGLVSVCGGEGTCGRCLVQVLEGTVSPLTETEGAQIAAGFRLACLTQVLSDVKVRIPPASCEASQRLELNGVDVSVPFDPSVQEHILSLSPLVHGDQQASWDRLAAALAQKGLGDALCPDVTVRQRLPGLLRESAARVRISLRGSEVVDVRPPAQRPLGLAVDLGTTKLAAYLVDMEAGQTIAVAGCPNPQIAYGADVMSRINYAMTAPNGALALQRAVLDGIHGLVDKLCAEPEHIVDAVLVGNTAMHHLFLGLPVRQLGLAPYVAAVTAPVDVKARDVGLRIGPGAYLHLLPNIAGFVGADHVAMILATGIDLTRRSVLGLDIGTNTEVVLAHHGQLTCCSTASGPAFEGGHVKHGVRAIPGAIEQVRLTSAGVQVKTIGGAPAIGICGSGIVAAISELRRVGLLDKRGHLQPGPGVRSTGGQREFVLVAAANTGADEDICITQRDIAEIQLAKAAIRTGIDALLELANLASSALSHVVLAGAFGSHLNPASAMGIGMLPALPLERFDQVGNAAGAGARLALVSQVQRLRAEEVARRTRHLDLMLLPDFADRFAGALYLPDPA